MLWLLCSFFLITSDVNDFRNKIFPALDQLISSYFKCRCRWMLWFYSMVKDNLERCQKVILIKFSSWWRLTYLKCLRALTKLSSSVCVEHLVCATGIKWHASCHYTAGVFCPSPVSLGIMVILDNSAIYVQCQTRNKYALCAGMWRVRVWRLLGWMGV